jgi:OpgC protein
LWCDQLDRFTPQNASTISQMPGMSTNGFALDPGLWDAVHGKLDDDKRVLGIARLLHFLALAYVVHHSGLTQLMHRTAIYAPLCLIGRYSLPVFATGAILFAQRREKIRMQSEPPRRPPI